MALFFAICRLRGALIVALLVLSGAAAYSQQRAKPQPAPKPVPPAPAPLVLPSPPTPVIDMAEAGVTQCVPMFDQMSRQVLTRAYKAQSGWSKADPSRHVFASIAALSSPGNTPSDGIAALIAAPREAGCDGVTIQIFPLAGDCPSAAKVMLQSGSTMTPLMNTRVLTDNAGHRIILMPGSANTCVAVSVDTLFGDP